MNLEFRIFKLKESSSLWKTMNRVHGNNQYILVGEQDYKGMNVCNALGMDCDGDINVLKILKLNEMTFLFPKEDLIQTDEFVQFDIPPCSLTPEILISIDKFNKYGILKLDDVLMKEIEQIKII